MKKGQVVLPGDSRPELLRVVDPGDGHIRELWGNPMTLQAEWFVTAWTREDGSGPTTLTPDKNRRKANVPQVRQDSNIVDFVAIACLIVGGSVLACAIGSLIGSLLGR